jgi:RimJ/RimL family protein N-acetyltransferase
VQGSGRGHEQHTTFEFRLCRCSCSLVRDFKGNRQAGRVVNYHHREIRNRRLEIGYIIDRSLWRTGLMSEAVCALIDHCLQDLDTYRIEATVGPANLASLSFLERLGFTRESGPMRARMWTSDGRKLDALMLALLKPDWRRGTSTGSTEVRPPHLNG